MNDDFVALEDWELLGRDRVRAAVDMALKFVRDGRYRQAERILACLNHRLAVDQSIEIYFEARRKLRLDGRECYALHQ